MITKRLRPTYEVVAIMEGTEVTLNEEVNITSYNQAKGLASKCPHAVEIYRLDEQGADLVYEREEIKVLN